jgi:hypothetical protein
LYLGIVVDDDTFSINLTFKRNTTFTSKGITYEMVAGTCQFIGLGTLENEGSSYILESLEGSLDELLNEYLITNMPK